MAADVFPASLIMPLLTQPDDWLERSVLSALNQSVACPLIVVTSDKTPASNRRLLARLEEGHRALTVAERAPEQGFAGALNTGLSLADSERVGFLLSDDWLEPQAVEECLGYEAEIVSSGMTVYAADGQTLVCRRPRTRNGYQRCRTLDQQASYLGYFFLFRKSALLQVGGVDETVGETGVDDFDLIWTLLEQGARVALVEKALYNCRDHGGPRLTLREKSLQVRDLSRILDKHGVSGPLRQQLIASHSRWYGKTIASVLRES